MKLIKWILLTLVLLGFLFFSFMYFGIIWKSPGFYQVDQPTELKKPVMDMTAYEQIIQTHRRPYCYTLNSSSGGKAYILGIEHTRDVNHAQLDTIRKIWKEANPTVALVEGRLGFLFSWIQNPIQEYGEAGLVSQLAKEKAVNLYTWEPTRDNEISFLLQEFTPEQIALFYSFRPYFSTMRFGKPENPEEKLQEYLESRTDYEHIRGVYKSWEELDQRWQKDFPGINWRDYSDEYGWPKGYLSQLANSSNMARDYHMIQIISDLVKKGETVFVTMGSSHAPRIEEALKAILP
jgi:hypothetical protein